MSAIPWHVNDRSLRYRALTGAANLIVAVLSVGSRRRRCAECDGRGAHVKGCAHEPGRQFTAHQQVP